MGGPGRDGGGGGDWMEMRFRIGIASFARILTKQVQYTWAIKKIPSWIVILPYYTDKKENKISLIYREILIGSGAKSYMRKGFLI
jgi:hypothetical protein